MKNIYKTLYISVIIYSLSYSHPTYSRKTIYEMFTAVTRVRAEAHSLEVNEYPCGGGTVTIGFAVKFYVKMKV